MHYSDNSKDRLMQSPFRPFRLHKSDGSSYEIMIGNCLVCRVEVGVNLDNDWVPGKAVLCSMLHITKLEDMTTNRQKRRNLTSQPTPKSGGFLIHFPGFIAPIKFSNI